MPSLRALIKRRQRPSWGEASHFSRAPASALARSRNPQAAPTAERLRSVRGAAARAKKAARKKPRAPRLQEKKMARARRR